MRRFPKQGGTALDPDFVDSGFFVNGEESLAPLDALYRFAWIREAPVAMTITLGSTAKVGPFNVRYITQSSNGAVPLREVPLIPQSP